MVTSRWKAGLPIAVLFAACSDSRAPLDDPAGAARQPFCRSGFAVANIQVDPTTIYNLDPTSLLVSAEGCGPRTLDLVVSTSLSPSISYNGTYTPTDAQLSQALGYSVTATFLVEADSTVLVPVDAYARVDAYPTYQRAAYQVVGSDCPGQVVVGSGVALKPVGVYFNTCGVIGTPACGVGCVGGVPNTSGTGASSSSGQGVPPGAWGTGGTGGAGGAPSTSPGVPPGAWGTDGGVDGG